MIKRRDLVIGSGAALAVSSGIFGTAPAISAPGLLIPTDIPPLEFVTVKRAPTKQKIAALTFDDGPHPTLTPKLLDILKARDIRATFFVIGKQVARYPEIVKRIAGEGHEIGNHSWSHPALSALSKAKIFEEIDRTNEAVYSAVRRAPVTLRPPYGALTYRQRQMVHDERAMPSILWSVDPEDWRKPGATEVANRIVGHTHPGAVILSHDIHAGTVEAMPLTLDTLKSRGYGFATVSMILGQKDWSTRRFPRPELVAQTR